MTINYGEITCPKKWSDVSTKQYIEISRLYGDDKKAELIDMIPILINKDKDYVMSLPSEFLGIILEKIQFITEQPNVEPSNEIKIKGETYIINYQNKLKVGEYLAADVAIKEDPRDIARLLSIICRKKDEPFDIKYTTNVQQERIKMFEEQPITKVLPLFFFMMTLYATLQSPFILSSSIKEEISHIQENIESLAKDGEIGKRTLKSVTKKLTKYNKTINKILKST